MVLKLSKSGYYKSLNKKPSATAKKRKIIAFHARVFHKRSKGIYGYRKIYSDFKEELPEISCSMDTVRKIMHEKRLFSYIKKKHRYPKADTIDLFEYPNNRLNRNYSASVKNLKLMGDITATKTAEGWLYLSAVMDLFSRKIVGWSTSTEVNSVLVCKSLNNAI